jgi:glycosyltransferase involved in cell wall biosynthesis
MPVVPHHTPDIFQDQYYSVHVAPVKDISMKASDLRIALFSGNYNYIRDGANQALNRLVGTLLEHGAAVRVYSPTTDTPAFPPTGDLVSIPSIPFPVPGRSEYRFPIKLSAQVRQDLNRFQPNLIHVSSPDIVGRRAVSYAHAHHIPVVASMHTRFESYLRYYKMGFLEPLFIAALRRFYRRCNAVVAPSQSMAGEMHTQGMADHIGIWSRGIDHDRFNPARRDNAWRQSLGIDDDDIVIGFLGRVVMEKGLDVFCDSIAALKKRGVAHKILVVGDGPARDWLAGQLPEAHFVGFQEGTALARAVASMDILFNPSVTETFGNVTLEAMACAVPVVAADATGSRSIIDHGTTGQLVTPGSIKDFADALEAYCTNEQLRKTHAKAAKTATSAYDWNRINQALIDIYLGLVAK